MSIDYEIEEFGHRLGLSTLSLPENEAVRLRIGAMGTLTLEFAGGPYDRELLVSMQCPIEPSDVMTIKRLLQQCSWREGLPWPVGAGVFRDEVIVTARLAEEFVTAAQIENAVRHLMQMLPRS